MSVKKHPFNQSPTGAVYAIAITAGKWGFVRFFQGCSMQVLSVVRDTPEMPSIDWKNPPVGWIFSSFAPNADTTQALQLGIVPFPDEDSKWASPCFVPPDRIDNCYKIHDRWSIRRATEREVQGMRQCRTVTPAKLAEFLREKLSAGELHQV